MDNKGKYIGINQRIPFEVLDDGIQSFLINGFIDKTYLFERVQEFTPGPNRAKKAAKYIAQILTKQTILLNHLKKAIKEMPYKSFRIEDRKAISLCLISLTYPITYDLLIALAQGFKVQEQLNKKFISEKVMSIYGSNRTVDIAIDALLPMIIELNAIKRDKVSIYSLSSKLCLTNKFVGELVIYTDIKLSGSKSILIDDITYKPWFSFFNLTDNNLIYHQLIAKRDSAIGNGYLTLSS